MITPIFLSSLALAFGQVGHTPAVNASPLATLGQPVVQSEAQATQDPTPAKDDAASKDQEQLGFVRGVLKAYKDAFHPDPNAAEEKPPKRRALPAAVVVAAISWP